MPMGSGEGKGSGTPAKSAAAEDGATLVRGGDFPSWEAVAVGDR